MDWLVHNPVADMPGPQFLVVYALVAAAALALAFVAVANADPTGRLPPPPLPVRFDPFETAHLAGGARAAVVTAVYALKRRGLVETTSGGSLRANAAAGFAPTHPVERVVFARMTNWASFKTLLDDFALRAAVERAAAPMQARLLGAQLLASDATRATARLAGWLGLALLSGLSAYKIAIALSRGHTKIGLLVVMTIAALAVLFAIVRGPASGRASARGRAYLKQARSAYREGAGDVVRASNAGDEASLAPALAMVALFGLPALVGTDDAAFAAAIAPGYDRKRAGDDSSSGGCGSSSCGGGGGGCGGCGGGGGGD